MNYPIIIHYCIQVLPLVLNALGVSIGQASITNASFEASAIQPSVKDEITHTALLGMVLLETSTFFLLVIWLVLFFGAQENINDFSLLSELGISLALGLSGITVGIACCFPARAACFSISRQPFLKQKIQTIMLATQSITQTPIIFAFIISLIIKSNMGLTNTLYTGVRMIAAGLCIGLGSIGPIIGLSLFATAVCRNLGINRNIYHKILTFTFISQAIIETPMIFAFAVTLVILNTTSFDHATTATPIIALLFSGIAMSISTCAPSITSGKIATQACNTFTNNIDNYDAVSRISIMSQGLVDTCVVYGLVIALMLIFIQ